MSVALNSINTNLTTASPTGAATSAPLLSNSNAGSSATMSFGAFLDALNPLQHIPVISSIYRAVTGDAISPGARVAGDIMYGAALGPISAGLAALGSIADEAYAADTGTSATGTMVASLLGEEGAPTQLAAAPQTQQASAAPSPEAIQIAGLQTPIPALPQSLLPDLQSTPTASIPAVPEIAVSAPTPVLTAAAQLPAAVPSAEIPAQASPAANGTGDKAFPLDRSKMPYGGVMDTAMMQRAMQTQTLALAMAQGQQSLQAERALRAGRLATGTATASSQPSAVPQDLMNNLAATKATGQYNNAAQSLPLAGSALNITN